MPGIDDKSQAQGWHVHNARLRVEQEERDGLRPKRLTRREPPARPVDPELAAEYARETGATVRVVDQKRCPFDGYPCGREECRGGRCRAGETVNDPDADPFDLGIAPPRRAVVARYLAREVIPWRLLTRAEVEQASHHADPRVRARARRQLHRLERRIGR